MSCTSLKSVHRQLLNRNGTPCQTAVSKAAAFKPLFPKTFSCRSRIRQAQTLRASPNANSTESPEVIIIGAGLAGLSCATHLAKSGVSFQVLEASDDVGGRVRTDVVDGFVLDRGFQIFLTGYQEAQAMLDYDELKLQPFYAGASVWYGGQFQRVADPLRHFVDGVTSLPNDIGSVQDKVNVGLYRLKCLLKSPSELLAEPETTTMQRLKDEAFSDDIIQRFFRPFLGGIFFNTDLTTSSRLFSFVMRTLATGSNCLPERGIAAMAKQLADKLPQGVIQTDAEVSSIKSQGEGQGVVVQVKGQASLSASRGVVVAVDEVAAEKLLGSMWSASPSKPLPGVGTCCLYFSCPSAPLASPMLYLNGEGRGIVNNMCFPSTVAPSYAPAGKALVSVSTVGVHPELSDTELEQQIREHMSEWWGSSVVSQWQHIRTYRIPFAQPNQTPPTNFERPVRLGEGVYVCGDHRDAATFEGALKSGRRTAEAVVQDLKLPTPQLVAN